MLSGIVSPVPVLGKTFRGVSGTGMYNRWIYGTADIRDQVIPFAGELFIDLRVPGVLIGFAILGAVVARLQLAFINARTAPRAVRHTVRGYVDRLSDRRQRRRW